KNVTQNSSAKTRVKRSLPPDFDLTPEWTKRLWEISRSTIRNVETTIGYCGICMLHAMQMLAELQEYHNSTPPQDGEGYFFNTRLGVDPFDSLRFRFPGIAERLEVTEQYTDIPYYVGEDMHIRISRISRTIASMFLTQYVWRSSAVARTNDKMRRVLQELVNTPPGTLGFVTIIAENSTGMSGHVQPFLRTRQWLTLIPTNTPDHTLGTFRNSLISTTNPQTFLYHLSERGTQTLRSISTFQMNPLNNPPLNLYVSQRNCTGEGEHRRGNRGLPRASLINQCRSSRCAIQ
ncbi:DUF1561 family protein, partial [Bartonella bacilliformis]